MIAQLLGGLLRPKQKHGISLEEAVEYRDAEAEAQEFARDGFIGRVVKRDGRWVAEREAIE